MAHIGTLRDYRFKGDVDDIRGANLYGRGGEKLGEVKDVIFDHATGNIQYLVVDTGGWLKSREFLVPAERINSHAENNRDFSCNLTKDQIERFPEYNDEESVHDEKHWHDYESRYRESYVTDGDVLHRAGSDHLITPEATEMPAASGNSGGVDFTPTRISDPFKAPSNPMRDDERLRPAGMASRIEDAKMPGSALSNESAEWSKRSGVEAYADRRSEREIGTSDVRDVDVRREPVVVDRDLNSKVNQFSSREDLGDVDVETARPVTSDLDSPAYGDIDRTAVPTQNVQDPPSYRAHSENLGENARRGYPVVRVEGSNDADRLLEHHRLRDFENHLRQNRVDITASCRACGVDKKDRAA